MNKWLVWSLIVALSPSGNVSAVTTNSVVTVTPGSVPQIIQLDGLVVPVNRGTVAAQTSGRVVGVFVDVNDHVDQGAVLLEISDVQQSALLDAAQAQLTSALAQNREAQSQISRYRQLFPKGAISQDQMDTAEAKARSAAASVKSAQAAVAQAKESLGYTSITAPYAGVVTQRHVELGETVSPGTPLVSGFSMQKLRIETEIPQRYHTSVTQPEQFHVLTPSGKRVMPTQYSLFSYADPQSHSFKLRLSLPENVPELVPGMWVKADFQYGQRDVLLIPATAVIHRAELSAVYRMVEQNRVLNPIRIGQTYGDDVEVLSGLEPGDRIVSMPVVTEGQ